MTPADLTLEDIAADETPLGTFSGEIQAVLAREIIALREAHVYLATYVGVSEENARDGLEGHRQDALESQARPFQESGELAVGRESKIPVVPDAVLKAIRRPLIERAEIAEAERDEALRSAAIAKQDAQMFGGNYEVMLARVKEYEAERDAAIARADEAERERDEWQDKHLVVDAEWRSEANRVNALLARATRVEAERDAARAWLREHGKHDYESGCYYGGTCTCGLTEALDGSGQHA